MDPFQRDVGGLDDDAFMHSLEGVQGQVSLEQEAAALLPDLPVSAPSISRVRKSASSYTASTPVMTHVPLLLQLHQNRVASRIAISLRFCRL